MEYLKNEFNTVFAVDGEEYVLMDRTNPDDPLFIAYLAYIEGGGVVGPTDKLTPEQGDFLVSLERSAYNQKVSAIQDLQNAVLDFVMYSTPIPDYIITQRTAYTGDFNKAASDIKARIVYKERGSDSGTDSGTRI
jgi:hypothetical protein